MVDRTIAAPIALPPPRPRVPDHAVAFSGQIMPDVLEDALSALPPIGVKHPRIAVIGVGGGGSNALRQMPSQGGVRRIAMNTDTQALLQAQADERFGLGEHVTQGRGTGGQPDIGERAAEASRHQLMALLRGLDLVFVTTGLGGGTGTGAAPVIARLARAAGALTIGLVTLPFTFEGSRRLLVAREGLARLEQSVDALITIPNDRLLRVMGQHITLHATFDQADRVLAQGVGGIIEIVTRPGLINVDFADIRALLQRAGHCVLAVGHGTGAERVYRAVEEALGGSETEAPLRGVQRLLLHLTAPPDLTLLEVTTAADLVTRSAAPGAECVFGTIIDAGIQDTLHVTLIAAGLPPRRPADT